MTLPVLTTAEDVLQIVGYLKNKPTGATTAEGKSALKSQVLDARKITAYIAWGLISRDGDRLKLTNRGWDLARKPDSARDVFRAVLDSIVPYRSALEWAHYQRLATITNTDVAAHWHEHHRTVLGTDNENTIKDNAVCFFHICQAAGLGKLTIGRQGQQTRLNISAQELKTYIEAGPSSPPWAEPDSADVSRDASDANTEGATEGAQSPVGPAVGATSTVPEALRVFISHGKNMEIVDQVQALLELADIESEVAEAEETAAIPVPDKVFNAMRRCHAGIIAVTVEERRDNKGNFALNENVLIEIGAAFVLYDRRVVLLWDKRLPVPSNLQGLYRCEFEGNELAWGSGLKLMKAIQGFKKQ